MTHYAVRAEDHDGQVHTLRRFEKREDAEEHPVKMKHWRRVWIDEVTVELRPYRPPTLPWSIEWEGAFAYVKDVNGARIASLLGSQKTRETVAAIIMEIRP